MLTETWPLKQKLKVSLVVVMIADALVGACVVGFFIIVGRIYSAVSIQLSYMWITFIADACVFPAVSNNCCTCDAGAALFGNHSHIRTYQLPYTMHDDAADATG